MAWQKLGSTKLTSAADTITVDNLTAKKHLIVQGHIISSGQGHPKLRLNNDSGSNYARRYSQNDGAESVSTNATEIVLTDGFTDINAYFTINIINESSKEKLIIVESLDQTGSGAGNAPRRLEVAGKWANTSNQITEINIINTGTGDFDVDSEVTVYGTDSDSVGGDPIATINLENNYIFEETDTGKHYLWSTTTSTWTEIA